MAEHEEGEAPGLPLILLLLQSNYQRPPPKHPPHLHPKQSDPFFQPSPHQPPPLRRSEAVFHPPPPRPPPCFSFLQLQINPSTNSNPMADPQNQEASLSSSSSSPCISESEDLQRADHAPPFWRNLKSKKRTLSKQLSMYEAPRNIAWERRRRQFERKNDDDLTDEDLKELKGCIELGFGFNAEDGQKLCTTIPALDLYFAVNRQFLTSPLPSPGSGGAPLPPRLGTPAPIPPTALKLHSCSFGRPPSPMTDSDSWKILSPGDDPQQVKTKLRHWAQAVACSVMQSPIRGGGKD